MATRNFKKTIAAIFSGMPFPVFNKQLRGMLLPISPLMSGRLYFNEVEPQVHNVYDLFIKPGYVFFDIGANVGLHSYYVARRFSKTEVHAFEPLPANAAYIRSAVKLNSISNIKLYEEAVAEKKGTVYFDQSVSNHQGRISVNESGMQVKVTSLDIFISESGVRPDFIKVDVEGAESLVMEGFGKNIKTIQPVMMIEVHSKEQSDKILSFFRSLDYKLCRLVNIQKGSGKYFHAIYPDREGEDVTGQLVAVPASIYGQYEQYVF